MHIREVDAVFGASQSDQQISRRDDRRSGRAERSAALFLAISGLVLYPLSLMLFPDEEKLSPARENPAQAPAFHTEPVTATPAAPATVRRHMEPRPRSYSFKAETSHLRPSHHVRPVGYDDSDNSPSVTTAHATTVKADAAPSRPGNAPATADPEILRIQQETAGVLNQLRPTGRAEDIAQIDELLLSGNYSAAAAVLTEGRQTAVGMARDQMTLRLALCSELQSKPEEALDYYRSLMAGTHIQSVSDVAILSMARIMITSGREEVGTQLLMRLLLARESLMDKRSRAELLHALASGLMAPRPDQLLLKDSEWTLPRHSQTPEELLESWSQLRPAAPRADKPADEFQMDILTRSPQGILLTVQRENVSASEFLKHCLLEAGWLLDISEEDNRILRQRRLNFAFRELPFDLVLDCLLEPVGFHWSVKGEVLSIRRIDPTAAISPEHAIRRTELTGRFLQLAVNLAPEHRAAPMTWLLLGAHKAEQGLLTDARRQFLMCLELYPRSPAVGPASLNLGKVCLLQGDRDAALKHFYRTVDLVSGPQLDSVAYIFIGRMLLENDTPRDAMVPLIHALALSRNTRYQAPTALLLAAAWLMDGNPRNANRVLVDHAPLFDDAKTSEEPFEVRMGHDAAFLSALARHEGSHGPQRMREARALLAALTNVRPTDSFGEHMDFLIGVAFGIVGLDAEMNAVFQASLTSAYRFPLQNRMHDLISGRTQPEQMLRPGAAAGKVGEVGEPLTKTTLAPHGLIHQAEVNWRSGEYDRVISQCLQFLRLTKDFAAKSGDSFQDEAEMQRVTESRRRALQLLGRAYQAKGEHQKAVWCLTGVLPPDVDEQNSGSTDSSFAPPDTNPASSAFTSPAADIKRP